MTMMRPGLFLQREEPGSEPGNSLGCPDGVACSVCGVLGGNQCRASLLHKQHKRPSGISRVKYICTGRRGSYIWSPMHMTYLVAARVSPCPYARTAEQKRAESEDSRFGR